MPPTFGWDNLEDIAIGLADKFPDTDPLTVRFTDMHKWITELPASPATRRLQRIQTRSHPNGLARRIPRPPDLANSSIGTLLRVRKSGIIALYWEAA